MMPYEPTSRRPIADAFRATAHLAVRLCVRWGVHPDVISYLSMDAAGGAAVCFWRSSAHPWLLLLGPELCYVRLWFNMLDGVRYNIFGDNIHSYKTLIVFSLAVAALLIYSHRSNIKRLIEGTENRITEFARKKQAEPEA